MSDFQGKSDVMIDENEYPIILYEPNLDLGSKINKAFHVFSQVQEAADFAQSQGMSFLLIVPNDFNEETELSESLKKKKDFFQRRLADVEEEVVLKEVLSGTVEKSHKILAFFTRKDFESEVFIKEEVINWEAREMARRFRKAFVFWERKERGLENIDAVFEYLEEPQGFAEFYSQEDYATCKEFCIKKLKELVGKRKQEKVKLIYYANLGKCCYRLKEHQKALEYYQLVSDILKQTYGETHALVACLLSARAYVCQDLCEYQKALEFHMRAFDITRSIYEEDHPETGESYGDLAFVYRDLGDLKKSLEYRIKALDIMKSRYGEVHFVTAHSYENLASAFDEVGEYQKGLEYNTKALEIRKALYGEMHPLTAISYVCIACSYEKLKENQQRLDNHLKALEIRKAGYGEAHPETARSFSQIADVYQTMREYQQALEYEQKALEIRRNTAGERNIMIASSYNNLGDIMRSLGDHQQEIEYYLKSLDIFKSIYGDKHMNCFPVKNFSSQNFFLFPQNFFCL